MSISKLQVAAGRLFGQDKLNRPEQDVMRINAPKNKKTETLTSRQTSASDKVSVSDVWRRVARNVDVRNAAPREIIALSSQLYKADAISYDDHISLSFQPEINFDSASESQPFSHERKDYIVLWRAKQDNVIRSGGDRNQIEDTHRIQAILTYVDSLK